VIDHMLHDFRRASRELYNQFFHQADPIRNRHALSLYAPVEARLFQAMSELAGIHDMLPYGIRQPAIAVRLNWHQDVQIRLCPDPNMHEWHDWIVERHENVIFSFVRFTDLHDSYEWDYHYVMAQVEDWPNHPDLVGHLALIGHEFAVYYRERPKPIDLESLEAHHPMRFESDVEQHD
jgi:hypothetical protein